MPPEEMPTLRFLTIEQVAEQLNVGTPQIRALLRTGELRGFQIGGRRLWRIGADDFENYIAEAYQQTARRIESGEVLTEVRLMDEAQHEL